MKVMLLKVLVILLLGRLSLLKFKAMTGAALPGCIDPHKLILILIWRNSVTVHYSSCILYLLLTILSCLLLHLSR